MAERMSTIRFENLLNWIFREYEKEDLIFGITSIDFLSIKNNSSFQIFGEQLDLPIGPAAGPHTQLSQNIISSYLAGGRFFELKTVQIKDDLKIDKPCIDAQDECYNVEWSQELKLEESFDEYLKAWMILHLLKTLFYSAHSYSRGFIFNMSVGYNLEGIKSEKIQKFIDLLIDASSNPLFAKYKNILIKRLQDEKFLSELKKKSSASLDLKDRLVKTVENISPRICSSVTLSTMHGCPSDEIEAISKYLLKEKKLHTYIKLNPTLLGHERVNEVLQALGFKNIELKSDSFKNDLKYENAVAMISQLQKYAVQFNREFGIKLSNTLPVKNKRQILSGDEMYMSGRSLFPLTINLASKLVENFNGEINISYSGGASIYNTSDIIKCGIYPVTYATDLLKPGGYRRLTQIVIKITSKLEKFDCFVAPCVTACPIHQDVPEYVKLVEEGRYEEAFDVIVSKNALPNITAHICDHQCQFHCTRWDYDEPVKIRDLKKVAVDEGRKKYLVKIFERKHIDNNKIRCAVVGAGPSGLAASYFLAQAGFDITVFEKHDKAGGVVQNIIPEFRLPQSAIDNDVEFIKQLGVKFEFNVNSNFSVEELKQKGFKYIYIAVGAGESRKLQLKGNEKNVIDAIDLLWKYNHNDKMNLGKIVAVIGGGNSAMDAARVAKRIGGVERVYILYRRTKEFMPADKEEFDNAIEDGVIFRELLAPIEFNNRILRCQRMKLGKIEEDGRREAMSIENKFEEHKIDFIISAIGEKVDHDILGQNKISINKFGKVETNTETNETLLENVFIGGDALRGPSTVVESIADGKKAAEAIIRKENIQVKFERNLKDVFDVQQRKDRILKNKGNVLIGNLSVNFEAARCLEGNFIFNKCVDVCPNRANIPISLDGEVFNDINQILHIDWMCNECGNCETFCPHQGSPYKDKITLFAGERDFSASKNSGFYVIKSENGVEVVSRFKTIVEKLRFSYSGEMIGSVSLDKDEDEDYDKFVRMIGKIISDYSYLFCNTLAN